MAMLLEPGMQSLRMGANSERCPTPSPPGSPGTPHDSCSIAPLTPSQSPRSEARSQQTPSFSVVVAIDFGTTSSGYAFSFTSDPEAIHMMRCWLSAVGSRAGWLIARLSFWVNIRMFGEGWVLQHSTTPDPGEHQGDVDTHWEPPVPVPSPPCHRVSPQAGLVSPEAPEQLLIALEPEAASIYCRKLRLHQLIELSCRPPASGAEPPHPIDSSFRQAREQLRRSRHSRTFLVESGVGELWSEMQAGDRYIVADCGGGTVDLTVHQIEKPQGTLKELYKASGGPYGAVGVDLAFEKLLCHIFGDDFIATFKAKRPAAWVDLTIAFEARKRAAAPSRSSPLNISLPFSFIDFYRKHRGHNVETALRKSNVNLVKWSSQGMLRMSPEAMNELFQPTITHIIQHIDTLLKKPEVQGIKFLFLVGGFAESAMLQRAVQAAFGHCCRVIVPQDVGLTILKGAVLFGLDPGVVRVRRSPLTYGVGVLNKFVEGKHPREKLLVKEGKNWCTDIFEKFVAVDQSVALGEVVQRSYCPARPGQRRTIINIYCCDTDDVVYITDPGVRKCGTISLELGDVGDATGDAGPAWGRREIRASMQFGDTEIKVTALDTRTARSVRATIDFLSN
ncbi:heat shock 70 kDa protein 12B [Corvus cornix cornix]|uniref:heat shock 70 kDa protein 12B n=1 Tax=Corvus cornix cornix TaxID=932674 RepID=UPI0019513BB9|nr:heat shock 70 kDa protein 12B [Corvus cornix cornix]